MSEWILQYEDGESIRQKLNSLKYTVDYLVTGATQQIYLSGLTDVVITNIQNDDILMYSATTNKWYNTQPIYNTSGTDGTSGSSGVNGTSGTNGTSGSSGVSGTSGSSGTSGTGFSTISNYGINRVLISDGTDNSAYASTGITYNGNLNITGDTYIKGNIVVYTGYTISGNGSGLYNIPYDAISSNVISVTYSQLMTLKNNFQLKPGRKYLIIDYQTTYYQLETNLYIICDVEQLLIDAVSTNMLSSTCRSVLHPNDVIYYDTNNRNGSTKGYILRRIDEIRNIDVGTDWRNILYRKNGADYLLFIGGYLKNIKIEMSEMMNSVFMGHVFNVTIGGEFYNNIIYSCYYNTIGDSFQNNIINNDFCYNSIGDNFNSNVVGNNFSNNSIGDNFNSNVVGDYFKNIIVGNNIASKNFTLISELTNKDYEHKISNNTKIDWLTESYVSKIEWNDDFFDINIIDEPHRDKKISYFRVYVTNGLRPTLKLYKNNTSELFVNWGDGTIDSTIDTGDFSITKDSPYTFQGYAVVSIYSNYIYDIGNTYITESMGFSEICKAIIGENVSEIHNGAFMNNNSFSGIYISDSVTSIYNYTFHDCISLENVRLSNNITSLNEGLFYNCYSLLDVIIPVNVNTIGAFAFNECSSLTGITIPNSVTNIDYYAFNNCYNLKNIIIGSGITYIGDNVFDGCDSLTYLKIDALIPPTLISTSIPIRYDLVIYVPYDSLELYRNATNWNLYYHYMVGYPVIPTVITLNVQTDMQPSINITKYGNK